MMTDPIADLLTRIRNGLKNKSKQVKVPHSQLKVRVVEVLKREGYIKGSSLADSTPEEGMGPQGWLVVDLKYGPDGEQVVNLLQRVSRPGRRIYKSATELKPVLNGLGIQILSTSKGVLSDREARQQNVGGEVLAVVH